MDTKTPEQRKLAIEIAQEVIALIDSGYLQPLKHNKYLEFDNGDTDAYGVPLGPNNLKETLLGINGCTACAIGGFFISRVLLYNNIFKDEFILSSGYMKYQLSMAFVDNEIYNIEAAFEAGIYTSTSKRDLLMICQNIINNNGEFIRDWSMS